MRNKTIFQILSVFTLTLLLNNEEGPGQIFSKIRTLAGIVKTEEENEYGIIEIKEEGEGFFAQLILCPVCLSGWFSAFILIISYMKAGQLFIRWLGVWGATILLLKKV